MSELTWAERDALRTWLLAQLDADEQEADELHDRRSCDLYSYDPTCCDCDYPDEVRADVAAKRRLIAAVADDPFDAMGAEGAYEMLVIQLLAHAYADKPGYDPAWAPA